MSNSVEVFMARQPIYRRKLELYAYELLFRQQDSSEAGDIDQEKAATALINSLIDIGLNELIGNTLAFINVSQDLLLSQAISMLPKSKVVLEILETVEPTTEVLERVKLLKSHGFTIALDDFRPSPDHKELLQMADIVKLDVLGTSEIEMRRIIREVRRPGLEILAERVETQAQYELCEKMGFSLFQGFFFAKPQLVRGNTLKSNQLAMLRLAARMQNPSLQYAELEEIISSDISLSYRLLKFVKSAHFGVDATVTSIRQALMFLGVSTVSAMATLLAMAGSENKSDELLSNSLVRAKMCEILASKRHMPQKDQYFTVGMLSLLDAILDMPMDQILAQLPLDPVLNEALIDGGSEEDLGRTLRTVVAFERGDWDECVAEGLSPQDVSIAYHAAVCWSAKAGLAA